MAFIIVSDLHLTDYARDEYRWSLFPWLKSMLSKHNASTLLILGDITDAKDKHPATLVNRLTGELLAIADLGVRVIILRGNHDGLDPNLPFFKFLSVIPGVEVITSPRKTTVDKCSCLFLPNTANYVEDWNDDVIACAHEVDFVFTHQSFDGCLSENGTLLRGVPPSIFAAISGLVYSGDIHVPQQVSPTIEYVGSPYRVRFGDSFKGRALLITGNDVKNLYLKTTNRHTFLIKEVADLDRVGAKEGDQVKVRVQMTRADYHDWPRLKQDVVAYAKKAGWELFGPELVSVKEKVSDKEESVIPKRRGLEACVTQYAEAKNFSKDMADLGFGILCEVKDFS